MTRPLPRFTLCAVITALLSAVAMLTGCSTSTRPSPSSSASAGAAVYDEPVLKVTGAFIRQPPTADMAAGYLTITNTGRQPDKLTGVSSDIATSVSMHRTTAANQMEMVKSFTIPAGGTLTLRTGGNHLMLMGLQKKPTAGETVTLQLRFAASDTIAVQAPVKPTTYQPPN
ncbi:copper chaperone PCu(A)C [Streptomyces sp. NBC_00996]|uniref:copper chaperone PCu(A)C n=1 Tax=Streptomyces sp. NBC_00996 TaxID=2903710 RepID=UPI0038663B8A|nr:copper chaperone PCu(A)C [Streptomyces sp. NBC_00996]